MFYAINMIKTEQNICLRNQNILDVVYLVLI